MHLCFVVHRYPPFKGGSEYYVQAMAEECIARGYQATVYTNEHKGNLNGVHVTSDIEILKKPFDLMVVHGGDVYNQNIVLMNAHLIKQISPIVYMLILPSSSAICLKGMQDANFLGCSTQDDWNHCSAFGYKNKAVAIRHGIVFHEFDEEVKAARAQAFKKTYGIATKYMILSCGGFWQHKGFEELANTFNSVSLNTNNINDITLVLTGYHPDPNYMQLPNIKDSQNIRILYLEDRADVDRAMAAADLYVMNSYKEGFGLVLLEAMAQKVPWIARNIAGAKEMNSFGKTYGQETDRTLESLLTHLPETIASIDVEAAYNFLKGHYTIKHTVNDILQCIK